MTYEVTIKKIQIKQHCDAYFGAGKTTEEFDFKKEIISARGFFEKKFPIPSVTKDGAISAISVADINFYCLHEGDIENDCNLVIRVSDLDWHRDDFCKLDLDFRSDEKTIAELVRLSEYDEMSLTMEFEVAEWTNDALAMGRVKRIYDSKMHLQHHRLIDYEVRDIEDYLLRENCLNLHEGQVSDICKEFANSFRSVPVGVNKGELLDSINSLIASFRFTFHRNLDSDGIVKLKPFSEKTGFPVSTYVEGIDNRLKVKRDGERRDEALRIYNHLWSIKSADNVILADFPFAPDEARYLADKYLELDCVFSVTCERILLDLLIISDINEYLHTASLKTNIAAAVFPTIPLKNYRDEYFLAKEKHIKFNEKIFWVIFIGVNLISGGLSWGLSLFWTWVIAKNSETLKFWLFGAIYATLAHLWVMKHIIQNQNEDKRIRVSEEDCFNVLKNMCNLHYYVHLMDVKLSRHMLNLLATSGIKLQRQVIQIISLNEQPRR